MIIYILHGKYHYTSSTSSSVFHHVYSLFPIAFFQRQSQFTYFHCIKLIILFDTPLSLQRLTLGLTFYLQLDKFCSQEYFVQVIKFLLLLLKITGVHQSKCPFEETFSIVVNLFTTLVISFSLCFVVYFLLCFAAECMYVWTHNNVDRLVRVDSLPHSDFRYIILFETQCTMVDAKNGKSKD